MVKRKILPIENLSGDVQRLFDTINASSDLAVVVVTASYLDASLASLLQARLRKGKTTDRLLGDTGILGAFGARADLAYALELIDKPLYVALCKIMEIRNAFAHHHFEYSFNSPEVSALCSALSYAQELAPPNDPDIFQRFMSNARDQFSITAITASQSLLLKGLEAQRHRVG